MSAGPDEGISLVGLGQTAEDRCRKTGIVELDREVRAVVLAHRRPGSADLDVAREDAVIRSFVAGFRDGLDVDSGPYEKG